jgi:hypothetical protein
VAASDEWEMRLELASPAGPARWASRV